MNKFNLFQQNGLFVGTQLAAELLSSLLERRAFVVTGAYIQTPKGAIKPQKVLNIDQPDLRFWLINSRP